MNPQYIFYWFQNNLVTTFGADGEQVPEFQGVHNAVLERLKGVDLSQCQFKKAIWGESETPISQAEFFGEVAIERQSGSDR